MPKKTLKNNLWPSHFPKKPVVSLPKKISGTQVTILGCGTSSGVPHLGCKCKVCVSKDPKNSRLRASVLIQAGSKVFLIDTSPDLRTQALTNRFTWIDAVLFTHPHADHIHGIDELRSFNYIMARPIHCYGNEWTMENIRSKFEYIFKYTQEGGGKPQIELNVLKSSTKIEKTTVVPLEVTHGKLPVLGFRINNIAYITDCSEIPDSTINKLRGLDILILDCLRYTSHPTHFTVEMAIQYAKKINAKQTYFTHMGHEIEYKTFAKSLPKGMFPAYDGLVLRSDR